MKKLLLTSCLLFAATIANAQAPTPPTQPSEYVIKITPAEADILWLGLRELPVRAVESLMDKFRKQIVEQTPKPEAPKNSMGNVENNKGIVKQGN